MGLLLAVAAALGLERTIKEGADYFASLHRSDIMMTIKEGNWPAGRRGWPALEQWGGVDLLLPVTLFVEADEMLSKKIKIKNGISWSKQMTGCLSVLRETWAYLAGVGSPGSTSPDGK